MLYVNCILNKAGKIFRKYRKYLGREFLDLKQMHKPQKEKNYKLELTKVKNFCFVKVHMKRMKREARDLEKTFANHIANNGLVSRLCKEFSKLNSGKIKKS